MTKIDDMLKELCPNGVEWKELGKTCNTITSPKKLKKSDYKNEGKIAIVDQGEEFISGYIDIDEYLPEDEYVIFGDHSEHIKFIDFPFIQGADGLKILRAKDEILPKYLYYCFCNFYEKEKNYKRHWSKAKETLIPVPHEKIQEEIVKILDKFTDYVTELTAELTAELTLRQKQYTYFRDYLLNFDQDSSGGANNKVYKVEWKSIGDVCIPTQNISWQKEAIDTEYQYIDLSSVSRKNKQIIETTVISKATAPSRAQKIIKEDDILFATTRPTLQRYTKISHQYDNQICSTGFCVLRPSEKIVPNYLYYMISTTRFYDYVEINQSGASYPAISDKLVKDFKIPIPSLAIQSRIVQVLDNFDTVCNNLNIGLPKEIELRQKQYEFFRDKLLTFAAEGVYTESRVEEWDTSALIKLLQWVFGSIRVSLGAICDFTRGNGLQKKDFVEKGYPVIHYGQIYTRYSFSTQETISFADKSVFDKLKKAQTGDIIMATTSENVEDVGKAVVWEGTEEVGIGGHSCVLHTEQNSKYLVYYFMTNQFQIQKEKLVVGTKVIEFYPKNIEKTIIILPPLNQQSEIVSILDKFDTLTSDLSQGLPKEIAHRQQQYEYFRDKLLTF